MSHDCPHCGGAISFRVVDACAPISRIQAEVAHYYGLSLPTMLSDRRDARLARARQMAMFLARETTPQSIPAIGKRFNRDHSTVMHAFKVVKRRIASDTEYARDAEVLRARLAA